MLIKKIQKIQKILLPLVVIENFDIELDKGDEMTHHRCPNQYQNFNTMIKN